MLPGSELFDHGLKIRRNSSFTQFLEAHVRRLKIRRNSSFTQILAAQIRGLWICSSLPLMLRFIKARLLLLNTQKLIIYAIAWGTDTQFRNSIRTNTHIYANDIRTDTHDIRKWFTQSIRMIRIQYANDIRRYAQLQHAKSIRIYTHIYAIL